jgi:ferritin-like metal-binding protein YciE
MPDPRKENQMFERLNTPQELFHYKLGAALTMENTVLEMLGDLEKHAQRDQLKQQFRHHAEETRQQIHNIEQAFAALGEDADDSPCPAIEGLEKEGRRTSRRPMTAWSMPSSWLGQPKPSITRSPSTKA